jgi:predicted ATPase
LTQALQRLFGALAERHGLMIVLDDMGSLDEASLKLIEVMLPWLAGQRLLLVGTCHPGEFKFSARGRRTSLRLISSAVTLRVHLEPLSQDSVLEMVRTMATVGDVEADVLEAVYAQSAGKPLMVEEILQLLLRDKAVEVAEDRLVLKSRTLLDSLGTLSDPLGYRLRHLPEKVVGVLATAACVGRSFDFEMLNRVVGMDSDEVISILKWASHAGFIEEIGSPSRERFSFTHPLLQARLYIMVERRRRARLHLLIGAAIEELYEARLQAFLPRLILHYRESQQWTKALAYALRAADFYEGLHLLESATRSMELAWSLLSRAQADGNESLRTARRLTRLYQVLGRAGDARKMRELTAQLVKKFNPS